MARSEWAPSQAGLVRSDGMRPLSSHAQARTFPSFASGTFRRHRDRSRRHYPYLDSAGIRLHVHWCVLSAAGPRASEATEAAGSFLVGAASATFCLGQFRDGFFPKQGGDIKEWFEGLAREVAPDVILTHREDDAHQDHRQLWSSLGIRSVTISSLIRGAQMGR